MMTQLSSRFEDALVFATQLHAYQTRKSSPTPYIAHLLSVTALVLEAEFQGKHDTSVRDDAGSRANDEVYNAVMSNLYPVILEMGQRYHAQAKPIPGVAPKSWDGLSSLQKLNAIADATKVPVKTWMDSNEPGAKTAIGALQLSILAAIGQKA